MDAKRSRRAETKAISPNVAQMRQDHTFLPSARSVILVVLVCSESPIKAQLVYK